MREGLEGKVNHLTQLLQGALRKQDEMALEAADGWQKVNGSLGFGLARDERKEELRVERGRQNLVCLITRNHI